MTIVAHGETDKGLRREHNEDAFCVEESLGLFAVADGMGGHAAGDVASKLALDSIVRHIRGNGPDLAEAVRFANSEIFNLSQANPDLNGMGTTIVAAVMSNGKMQLAHVGDSRAYLIRGGYIEQLTEDHSLVAEQVRRGEITPEEAEQSQVRNIITRALGIGPDVEADLREVGLRDGDIVLLCTDGLYTMVREGDMLIEMIMHDELQPKCRALIELANQNGGRDNIALILMRYREGRLHSLINRVSSFLTRRAYV